MILLCHVKQKKQSPYLKSPYRARWTKGDDICVRLENHLVFLYLSRKIRKGNFLNRPFSVMSKIWNFCGLQLFVWGHGGVMQWLHSYRSMRYSKSRSHDEVLLTSSASGWRHGAKGTLWLIQTSVVWYDRWSHVSGMFFFFSIVSPLILLVFQNNHSV